MKKRREPTKNQGDEIDNHQLGFIIGAILDIKVKNEIGKMLHLRI